jgi:hypothetical protein
VVKGAVLRGMGIGMDVAAKAMPCPRHYGICVSQIYADWSHSSEHTVTDHFHGRQVVPNQLAWLIRKGDVILPGGPIVSTFGVECRFTSSQLDLGEDMRIIFVASAADNPPSSLSTLQRGKAYLPYFTLRNQFLGTSRLMFKHGKFVDHRHDFFHYAFRLMLTLGSATTTRP